MSWWYFIYFQREEQERASNPKKWYSIYEIEANLNNLIKVIVLSSLQNTNSLSLFRTLKEYIGGKDVNFLENLFEQSICSIIFENIFNSKERYNIWNHYFPPEWKINKETLEDPNNIISKIWLNSFFRWAPNRIMSDEEGKDFGNLDDVAKELFPSVEPRLWAKILTFLFRPWGNNGRMKSLVERGPNFGAGGRVFVSWGSGDKTEDEFNVKFFKAIEEQSQATIELALLIFPRQFDKEQLQDFINDLNLLKFKDETTEESRRKSFISIFEKMISLIDQRKS
jgi:hypothetical protein